MTNEEFQRIVLEELKDLKAGQGKLEDRIGSLEDSMGSFEDRMGSFEDRMGSFERKLDAVVEQTAILTEFKEDTSKKLDIIIEENQVFKEILGKHEVDIRRIQKRIV